MAGWGFLSTIPEGKLIKLTKFNDFQHPCDAAPRGRRRAGARSVKWFGKTRQAAKMPPMAPSFITRVCEFGFHIPCLRFGQARRARSPQIAQALDALLRVFDCGATGNYHRAIAYHLAAAGFEMKLVSSVSLARTREALHNSWDKNDPKDAQVILHMMEIGNTQFYHDPLTCGTNDIQELSKTRDIVSKSKTELWHRILTHYLPLYFPEADRFHRSSRGDWFFAFLERYPSPHLISAMDRDAFIAEAWDVVARKVAKEPFTYKYIRDFQNIRGPACWPGFRRS